VDKTKGKLLTSLGDPDWIRTSDPQLRRLLLYPAELRDRVLPFRFPGLDNFTTFHLQVPSVIEAELARVIHSNEVERAFGFHRGAGTESCLERFLVPELDVSEIWVDVN
jgi:hypothetical protein